MTEQAAAPNDRQVGGTHYRTATPGYQHWDWVEEIGHNYMLGQITRYLLRAHLKNGLEDLRKAEHYLEKLARSTAPIVISRRAHPLLVPLMEATGVPRSIQHVAEVLVGPGAAQVNDENVRAARRVLAAVIKSHEDDVWKVRV